MYVSEQEQEEEQDGGWESGREILEDSSYSANNEEGKGKVRREGGLDEQEQEQDNGTVGTVGTVATVATVATHMSYAYVQSSPLTTPAPYIGPHTHRTRTGTGTGRILSFIHGSHHGGKTLLHIRVFPARLNHRQTNSMQVIRLLRFV